MRPPALISCIVPVHNGERYLAETLDSIHAQTWLPIEVIVVDDGSTDRSLSVARAHPVGARCLAQSNAGHAAARNRGIDAAQGAFVAFLDADDLWTPPKLATQMAALDARPELGVVFTHLENFVSPDASVDDDADRPDIGGAVPGYSSVTMLARRVVFEGVGPFDVSLAHANDRDWFCRVAEAGVEMAMLPDVLVRRRLHASNRSRALATQSRSEYLRLLKRMLDRRRQPGAAAVRYPFGPG